MDIEITAGQLVFAARLDDTPAARAFAAMLPLDLDLSDYHNTEKIADLPARIPTGAAPRGYSASAGDITYFAPWGNLAIFYRDFPFSQGLVRLGEVTSDTGVLAELAGPVTVVTAMA